MSLHDIHFHGLDPLSGLNLCTIAVLELTND